MADFEVDMQREIKNILNATVQGDINVDVRIEYRPRVPHGTEPATKMTIDSINAKLSCLSGRVAYDVRESIKKYLSEDTHHE